MDIKKIKVVAFDKDGTIIEFSSLWIESFLQYIKAFPIEKRGEIESLVGIQGNRVKENSLLAAASLGQIGQEMAKFLGRSPQAITHELENAFDKAIQENREEIKETVDLKKLLRILKEAGLKTALVTADSWTPTLRALDILQIQEDFDFIATGDRYPNKPHPASLDAMAESLGVEREEILFVGDSKVDMEYGNLAGISVGVLSGVGSRQMLESYGDYVIEDLWGILEILEIDKD